MNIDAIVFNEIPANRIYQHRKRVIRHDQVQFMWHMQDFVIYDKYANATVVLNGSNEQSKNNSIDDSNKNNKIIRNKFNKRSTWLVHWKWQNTTERK